jgi:hypothetical protein
LEKRIWRTPVSASAADRLSVTAVELTAAAAPLMAMVTVGAYVSE